MLSDGVFAVTCPIATLFSVALMYPAYLSTMAVLEGNWAFWPHFNEYVAVMTGIPFQFLLWYIQVVWNAFVAFFILLCWFGNHSGTH